MADSKIDGIQAELETLKLLTQSSAFSYFFKRNLSLISPFSKKYDRNLLMVLDYAVQTKRYQFVSDLFDSSRTILVSNKQEFAKQLLKAFDRESAVSADDSGLKLIKVYINRYLDAHNLGYRISRHELEKKPKVLSAEYKKSKIKQANNRKKKQFFYFLAFLLAFLVAFPEGALAVYGYGVFTFVNVLVFGGSASSVSYFLYKTDIYHLIKNLFKRDETEEAELNLLEKILLNFIIVFAGIAMGILLFNAIYIPAGMLFFGFASAAAVLAAPLPMLIIIASFFALVTALANIALFKPICYSTYTNIKNFFKNSEWKKLTFSKILVLLVATATMIFAQLWFLNEAFQLLTGLFGLPANPSAIAAIAISVFGCLNGVFYGKNIFRFFSEILPETIRNIKSSVRNFVNAFQTNGFKIFWQSSLDDPYRLANKKALIDLVNYTVIAVLVVFCVFNATGIALGVSALLSGVILAKFTSALFTYIASFSANVNASYQEFRPLPTVSSSNGHPVATVKTYSCYQLVVDTIPAAKPARNPNGAEVVSWQAASLTP
ncbi:MAG: hypothetical protein KBD64_02255 [Gammaproteobacteria bacterium]|nr:hypothetical protein [Gammaproteobacteria bacterium]